VIQLGVQLSDDDLRQLADRVADLLAERGLNGAGAPADPDPWLDVDSAAEYLACKPKRLYDLKSQGRIRFARDGSRLLFRRSWLDEYVEGESAET
jgi:excisionase family DNA binding protein